MNAFKQYGPLAVMLLCRLACAQPVDSLSSAACKSALAALQRQEMLVAEAPGGKELPTFKTLSADLQTIRKTAAHDCLGGRIDSATPPRSVMRATVTVDPVNPGLRGSAHPVAPSPPSRRPGESPRAVTSCDVAGCWASDGTRLQRLGPDLVGPRGVCTVQGAVLSCP